MGILSGERAVIVGRVPTHCPAAMCCACMDASPFTAWPHLPTTHLRPHLPCPIPPCRILGHQIEEQALKVTIPPPPPHHIPQSYPPCPTHPSPPCRILGHQIEEQALKVTIPKRLSAPGLPELNHSQVCKRESVGREGCSMCWGA